MKIGVMQPYFLPYIGYWQLIKEVDSFVVYDDIKYTKKGWINRNRFLLNNKAETFSIALKNDSDFLQIKDRFLATSFCRKSLLNKIREPYRKAPYFSETEILLEKIVLNEQSNLFNYILNSIKIICETLDIKTND